ncbi:MAG: lycopene beta-cyclase CrtY [Thermoanaerobaculales bacterium]|nr:lycopene beta-cyclase CrtY [Thermoanaerobaculales bacterium]
MKTGLVLVGGGLANSLIASRILGEAPDFPLLIVERGPTLGGNHTWSYHDSDLTPAQRAWLQPLVAHSWPRHELRFPKRLRVMDGGYNSVTSERLHEVVGGVLGDRVLFESEVEDVTPTRIRLRGGDCIDARAVIDGRGDPGGHHLEVGFQKFVGLFVRLAADHCLDGPILMDATVEQRDGYRFVYTLPFSDRDLLIEDTYYSNLPQIDRAEISSGIQNYASDRGWQIAEVTGEESGVLPIVYGGDIDAFWREGPSGVARSGMRAALFHPTTGYSLPNAVTLADAITANRSLESEALFQLTKELSMKHWRRTGYYRLLNRMLFCAAEPDLRYRIFERFYGLSDPLIRRFYAGRLKWNDKIRVLSGKPPVPVLRALRCLVNRHGATGGSTMDANGGAP